jgi:hypothetical protein
LRRGGRIYYNKNMKQNRLEKQSSPEDKMKALVFTPDFPTEKIDSFVNDKVTRLKNFPDLVTLRVNIKGTSLSVDQFLSLLFKNLYQQPQVKQRVAEKLKEFNLTSEMLDHLFVYSAGEPFTIFFLSNYADAVPLEMRAIFKQEVNDVMLQELRSYLF